MGPSSSSYNLWTDLKDTVFSETNPPLSNNAWPLLTEASEVGSKQKGWEVVVSRDQGGGGNTAAPGKEHRDRVAHSD